MDISQLLNEKFKGTSLSELKVRLPDIVEEIKQHKKISEEIINMLSQKLLKEPEENIYLEGRGNVVSMLNLANHDRMCSLMQVIEQKKYLAQLLEEDLDSLRDTKVSIGKEHMCPEFEDVSLIKTTYKFDENPIGILGIIGPKHMEYSKMISLVNFVAGTVNKIINKLAQTK
jgi:heat-inducible transcriptional repressor